jgi:ATP-dependent RNA helicase
VQNSSLSPRIAKKPVKIMATTSRKGNTNNEDLSNVEFETSEDVEVVPTFQSMKLREELLRGIYAYGE